LIDAPVLRLDGITKRFGALVANDAISLDLRRGEVLALLGENGAGKSTLVSILFGHYLADAGRIEAFGEPLPPGQPRAALERGIGMVHQHFTLADNLSVLDNVMLGSEPLWQPFSRRAAARARLLATAQRFGLGVDPDAKVGELSVGERQRVEILKALVPVGRRRGARVLILDEPTAVLTPQESASLFATLARLVAEGLAIVFISHKLDEVLRVAHRIAVLRGGRLVAMLPGAIVAGGAATQPGDAEPSGADGEAPVTKARLAALMVGREVVPARRRPGGAPTPRAPGASPAVAAAGEPVLVLDGATVRGTGARPALDAVSLRLQAGEVVGIAGVSGNGQQVLAELLHGLRALEAGRLMLQGRPMAARPRTWVEAGVARVPDDRHAVGLIGDLSLWENAISERYANPAFSRFGWLRRGRAMAHAQRLVDRYDVRGTEAGGVGLPARRLSGGNMQRLILGRALTPVPADDALLDNGPAALPAATRPGPHAAPVLVVANQPTWGLDIGAVAYVHQQLLDACERGAAVLLISDDLDELFALADRLAVMRQGRLGEARPVAEWTLGAIGLAMADHAEAAPATGPGAFHAA
jgi:ABC-type uncharacterized transport system ATPase subunit